MSAHMLLSRLALLARLAPGPLALVAFVLPWMQGPGVLSGEYYSGFDLVRMVSLLQQLDLPASQAAALPVIRALLLAIPVAATWHLLLAPKGQWHWGYRAARAYLAGAAAVVALAGLYRAGPGVPPAGIALLLAAGALVLLPSARRPALPARGERLSLPRATRPSLPPRA